jgi:hypothetical protein
MITTLFEWADRHSMSAEELESLTGYSDRQLRRIRTGEYPVTRAFRDRVVAGFMDLSRSLFLAGVSEYSDATSDTVDGLGAGEEPQP